MHYSGVPNQSLRHTQWEMLFALGRITSQVRLPSYQLLDPKYCDYDVMIVSFSSITIKRACRATLQAETYALQNAQETGDKVRALLAELYGYGTTGPQWHDASRRAIPHVMLSDSQSLVANLNTEVPSSVQDKRLQIELDAIRQ